MIKLSHSACNPQQPDSPMELEKTICEEKDCNQETDGPHDEYCQEHYEFYYCECGRSLGEYAGEGFCKRCQ